MACYRRDIYTEVGKACNACAYRQCRDSAVRVAARIGLVAVGFNQVRAVSAALADREGKLLRLFDCAVVRVGNDNINLIASNIRIGQLTARGLRKALLRC